MWGLIAALVGIGGSLYQGYEQNQAAKEQADLIEKNAKANDALAAVDRQNEAREEAHSSRRRQAMIRAQYAKSGVSLSGTPELMLREQINTDEVNMMLGDSGSSARRAVSLWASKLEAKGYRKSGRTALVSGYIGAVGYGAQYGDKKWGSSGKVA
jgi:hypothetical protein